jgi:RNA polymerase sigma-70 factor (ECF subfamily)
MTLPTTSQLDQLLEAYRDGDTEAFERFFRLTKDVVYSYALKRIKNPEKAQDITQDTFLRIHRYVMSFKKSEGSAFSWMLGITRNCVADSLSDELKEKTHFSPGEYDMPSAELGPDETAYFRDLIQSLERQISVEESELLLERVMHEYSFEEIALRRGIRPDNARQRFSRIIKKIRSIL